MTQDIMIFLTLADSGKFKDFFKSQDRLFNIKLDLDGPVSIF